MADTHLGFDGDERFFTAFGRALEPARRGEVDFVVHGGDMFFRSRVKPGLVLRSFAPLKKIADSGVPVIVVPGNHERSAIPFPLLAAHPGIHIIDHPRTVSLKVRGIDVAVAGFPCERNLIASRFAALAEQSEWRSARADIRLLAFHQSVEGATVGPADFVFGRNADVIAGHSIPNGFATVLAGHIHRHQVLTSDLAGRPFAAPVFYPGSTERTSNAERGEAKGFLTLELEPDSLGRGRVAAWKFHELQPALSARMIRR